jgi:hypothetical protein
METKIDRSFPCLVLLPKRNSEQGYELPKTFGSDYVFFSPSIGLKHDPQYAPEEKQSGALPKGRTNFFLSVEGSRSSLRVSATASRVSACESS